MWTTLLPRLAHGVMRNSILEKYEEIRVFDHPHPDDAEFGNGREDKTYIVCGPCSVQFQVWLEPEVDDWRNLHSDSSGLFNFDVE